MRIKECLNENNVIKGNFGKGKSIGAKEEPFLIIDSRNERLIQKCSTLKQANKIRKNFEKKKV